MKIVISGNYGAGNIGDEMILEGMLRLLNDTYDKAEITVFSKNPVLSKKQYSVNSVKKFPSGFRSFLTHIFKGGDTRRAMKECDYFILGGGGLFGGPERRGNYVWAVQAFMAMLYRKPVLMIGQSVGMRLSNFEKKIVKKLFTKAKLIVVRDSTSKKNLKSIGVKKKIYELPDLALTKGSLEEKERSKTIIIALRKIKKIDKSFFDEIAKFIDSLPDTYKIKFINFKSGKESDNQYHQRLINQIKSKKTVVVIDHNKEADKIIKHFRTANFAICMRLHAVITAVISETPFIAINYATKVRAFTQYAKLGDYCIEMDEVKLNKILTIREKAKENQATEIKKFKSNLEEKFTRLQELLKGIKV